MPRYRFTVFGRPKKPWRATRAEAEADAIKAKMASRDDHVKERVYLSVGVAIERAE